LRFERRTVGERDREERVSKEDGTRARKGGGINRKKIKGKRVGGGGCVGLVGYAERTETRPIGPYRRQSGKTKKLTR